MSFFSKWFAPSDQPVIEPDLVLVESFHAVDDMKKRIQGLRSSFAQYSQGITHSCHHAKELVAFINSAQSDTLPLKAIPLIQHAQSNMAYAASYIFEQQFQAEIQLALDLFLQDAERIGREIQRVDACRYKYQAVKLKVEQLKQRKQEQEDSDGKGVVNAILAKKISKQITQTQAQLDNVEVVYLGMNHGVTQSFARLQAAHIALVQETLFRLMEYQVSFSRAAFRFSESYMPTIEEYREKHSFRSVHANRTTNGGRYGSPSGSSGSFASSLPAAGKNPGSGGEIAMVETPKQRGGATSNGGNSNIMYRGSPSSSTPSSSSMLMEGGGEMFDPLAILDGILDYEFVLSPCRAGGAQQGEPKKILIGANKDRGETAEGGGNKRSTAERGKTTRNNNNKLKSPTTRVASPSVMNTLASRNAIVEGKQSLQLQVLNDQQSLASNSPSPTLSFSSPSSTSASLSSSSSSSSSPPSATVDAAVPMPPPAPLWMLSGNKNHVDLISSAAIPCAPGVPMAPPTPNHSQVSQQTQLPKGFRSDLPELSVCQTNREQAIPSLVRMHWTPIRPANLQNTVWMHLLTEQQTNVPNSNDANAKTTTTETTKTSTGDDEDPDTEEDDDEAVEEDEDDEISFPYRPETATNKKKKKNGAPILTPAEKLRSVCPSISLSNIVFDRKQFEELFKAKTNKTKLFGGNKQSTSHDDGALMLNSAHRMTKVAAVELVDAKRAYNISICLARFHLNVHQIIKAVRELDYQTLPLDRLQLLSTLLPTQEEMKKIHAWKGPVEQLGNVEKFFHAIVCVPGFASQVQSFVFYQEFAELGGAIEDSIDDVSTAVDALYNSAHFRSMLGVILSLGNHLNFNSSLGLSYGFDLASLSKLTDIKTFDNQSNLLAFLVKYIHENHPAIASFTTELQCLGKASRVEMCYLQAEIKQMGQSLELLKKTIADNTFHTKPITTVGTTNATGTPGGGTKKKLLFNEKHPSREECDKMGGEHAMSSSSSSSGNSESDNDRSTSTSTDGGEEEVMFASVAVKKLDEFSRYVSVRYSDIQSRIQNLNERYAQLAVYLDDADAPWEILFGTVANFVDSYAQAEEALQKTMTKENAKKNVRHWNQRKKKEQQQTSSSSPLVTKPKLGLASSSSALVVGRLPDIPDELENNNENNNARESNQYISPRDKTANGKKRGGGKKNVDKRGASSSQYLSPTTSLQQDMFGSPSDEICIDLQKFMASLGSPLPSTKTTQGSPVNTNSSPSNNKQKQQQHQRKKNGGGPVPVASTRVALDHTPLH